MSKTLRKHILEKAGVFEYEKSESITLSDFDLSNSSSYGESVNDDTTTKAKKLMARKIVASMNKIIDTLKITEKTLPDALENLELFYMKLYYNIPFTKENVLYLVNNDVDVPISWLFQRNSDIITTCAFKVLSNGGTLYCQYGNDYTNIANTLSKHSVQYNFKAGYGYKDPNSMLRFQNISVEEIKKCSNKIFTEDDKKVKNDKGKKIIKCIRLVKNNERQICVCYTSTIYI